MPQNIDPANIPGVSRDPEWEALLEQLTHEQDAMESEWDQFQAQSQVEIQEAAQAVEQAKAQKPVELSEDPAWRQLASQVPSEPSPSAFTGKSFGLEGGLLAAAASALVPPALAIIGRKQERQWYYAQEEKSVGPVSQSQLRMLLERGEIPWATLVWNQALTEWVKAADTELAQLSATSAPPPLPGKAKAQRPACAACGRPVSATDRFCPACGRPLKAPDQEK